MNFQQLESVSESFGLNSTRLVEHLAYIFQDFQSISSDTQIMINALSQMQYGDEATNVLDLFCGKGATLNQLCVHFGWSGLGVEIVPEFVISAQSKATSLHQDNKVKFIKSSVEQFLATNKKKFDLIIFPYCNGSLGTLTEALEQLQSHLSDQGIIVLEAEYRTFEDDPENNASTLDIYRHIEVAGYHVIQRRVTDFRNGKVIYKDNFVKIHRRIQELKNRYPDLRHEFDYFSKYMEDKTSNITRHHQGVWLIERENETEQKSQGLKLL